MARLETTRETTISPVGALAITVSFEAHTTTINAAIVVSAGSTSRDLIHVGVAHGRGLHRRNRSLLVLLYFPRKCHAGARRRDYGNHKPRFPHVEYSL